MSTRDTQHVSFKDLCIDTSEPESSAAFWSQALGLQSHRREDAYVLSDAVATHTVWINPVPEPKSVKNRVHLDVHVAAVAELEALGATVVDDEQPWTVMADPDGGEFCAFVRNREDLARYRLYELCVDAADPERIARWWADRFGIEAHADDEGEFWYLDAVPPMPWEMVFAAVPEPKTVKNRVHWDLWGSVAQLTAVGATLLRSRDDEIAWDVLADPEGNEFCVFAGDGATG